MTSVLGKMVIILLIIFYTSVHRIYGVLFCLLVVLFYQLDNVKWVSEGFCDTSSMYSQTENKGFAGANSVGDDRIFLHSIQENNIQKNGGNECGCNKCGRCQQSKNHRVKQTDYVSIVDLEENIREKEKTEFQKRHCTVDGVLTYKDIPVKKDMSAIVFSEVKYDDENNICNLCDKNCKFRVSK